MLVSLFWPKKDRKQSTQSFPELIYIV